MDTLFSVWTQPPINFYRSDSPPQISRSFAKLITISLNNELIEATKMSYIETKCFAKTIKPNFMRSIYGLRGIRGVGTLAHHSLYKL